MKTMFPHSHLHFEEMGGCPVAMSDYRSVIYCVVTRNYDHESHIGDIVTTTHQRDSHIS